MIKKITYIEPVSVWDENGEMSTKPTRFTVIANNEDEYAAHVNAINQPERGITDIEVIDLPGREQRQYAYENLRYKEGGEPLIEWGEQHLTVDEANKMFRDYFAEDNEEVFLALQALIIGAKGYIREMYK